MSAQADDARRQRIWQALQQWSSDPAGAIETLRPLADQGDSDAVLLIAYIFMQQGRAPEGIPYARQAVDAGAAFIGANYAAHLMATPERPAAVEMMRKAQLLGHAVDPIGLSQQAAQAGDMDVALELLEVARSGTPSFGFSEERYSALMSRIEAAESGIENSVASVGQRSKEAGSKIVEAESEILNERTRVQELVKQVSGLVHGVASDHLAKEYAKQAKTMEDSATRYTRATLAVGVLTVVAAVATLTVVFDDQQDVGSLLSRFGVTLPLIVFGGYLGGLAASHRRMAWHWRHIELQIRTAEPFIAELDDEQRRSLLAVLALRFFPGQLLDPHGKSDERQGLDMSSLVSSFLRRPPDTPAERPSST